MREIKFRQWLNTSFHYFGFDDGHCSGVVSPSLSTYPIMQFAGLKDNNGKEIYEDDIVTIDGSNVESTYKIFYHKESCSFRKKRFWKNQSDRTYHTSLDDLNIMVIGNIYENPELT